MEVLKKFAIITLSSAIDLLTIFNNAVSGTPTGAWSSAQSICLVVSRPGFDFLVESDTKKPKKLVFTASWSAL